MDGALPCNSVQVSACNLCSHKLNSGREEGAFRFPAMRRVFIGGTGKPPLKCDFRSDRIVSAVQPLSMTLNLQRNLIWRCAADVIA